jgi:short-subunit dehydrogenase
VTLLVNNAGTAAPGRFLEPSTDSAQALMDTNYLGTLGMCQAFAPVLARNGGGALVNILSIVSFMSAPGMGPLSATKAALCSLTNGLRMELRSQGTHVLGVHPSFIATDLTAQLDVPKLDPHDVANWILDAIEDGREELLLGERTRACKNALPNDLELIYPALERETGTTPAQSTSAGRS